MGNIFDQDSANSGKQYILPDYTGAKVDNDDTEDDDEIVEEDEGKLESILDKKIEEDDYRDIKKESSSMSFNSNNVTPFGTPASSSGSGWGGFQSSPSSSGSSGFWNDTKPASTPTWGGGSFGNSGSSWTNNNIRTTPGDFKGINRSKRVIICDFLDCLVETWQSQGSPGLTPRGIYDLKPRLQVWERLAAFNPDRIYAIIPVNLIPENNNGAMGQGLQITLAYFCCAVSSFMKLPYQNCQILAQGQVGQPKYDVISSIINKEGFEIPKEDIIYVGINSGNSAIQSDVDKKAAEICGIDYLDLGELLRL